MLNGKDKDDKEIGYGPIGPSIVFGVVVAVAVAITAHDSVKDIQIV